jgi:hypothetical protein
VDGLLVHHDGAPFRHDDQSAVGGGFVEGWDETDGQTLFHYSGQIGEQTKNLFDWEISPQGK